VDRLAAKIKKICPPQPLNIMEVCGSHTQSFFRFGLDKILPSNLRLIAGPGCPVCVSSAGYIDAAVSLARKKDVMVLTFGDMLRIPGNKTSLEQERARSGNVRVVYSALESLEAARANPDKKVVFLAVGFETTAPTVALSILAAKKLGLENLSFLTALKLIPPAMEYLAADKQLKVHGFLCPGHVSAIIGTRPYEPIVRKRKITCCVAGFEPVDILEGIYMILRRIVSNDPAVDNQYSRVVKRPGNIEARNFMRRVFAVSKAEWRGLGVIPASGQKIRKEFARFDAEKVFSVSADARGVSPQQKKCRCGDVLKGLIEPPECPLFAAACSPQKPIGPCMVSSEGACNAYFKYRNVGTV
ncbi:MAG: hydrogenase formation protein HypD, partial [Candidatus Omnitrophota bacterium]|nr:hydrogenase formation protein HypD [Candidatus Omnitrophota bacterium]